jgi:predicted O-linked N-acetylglucosamine transferase (SPINDLY family)
MHQDWDSAIEHLRQATLLDPDFMPAWMNLGKQLLNVGMVDAAIDALRRAIALVPQSVESWRMLLFALSYTNASDQEILAEHRRYAELIMPKESDPAFATSAVRSAGARIRIGYFSPDFRDHPVASFIEPLLANHNQEQFKIFCYSNTPAPDSITERLRSYVPNWRDASKMSDDEFVRLIRGDELDILIDLAGHTRGGRMELFGRRLAPVQVSYLGYPFTTGLTEMDVRLTDSIADPPEESESGYSEQLVRLPNCFCCFAPPDAPPVSALPAMRNGLITFGTMQASVKVNDRVIELWSKVLAEVPASRLLMVRNTLTAATQRRLAEAFNKHGIDPERISFDNQFVPLGGHLANYHKIDISLDTFPFSGHTTACQSMWMGVPMVTLGGSSHRGRLVVSVLTHAGHPEWIARSPEEFVNIATKLATNLPALAAYRDNLRAELAASPLCDGKRFTREFEGMLTGITQEKLENPAPRP